MPLSAKLTILKMSKKAGCRKLKVKEIGFDQEEVKWLDSFCKGLCKINTGMMRREEAAEETWNFRVNWGTIINVDQINFIGAVVTQST